MPTPARLLIVDDEDGIRQVCLRVLSKCGYAVAASADAPSALKMLEEAPFDLVITDLSMPGPMNGVDLVKEIKTRWPEIHVVLMTAYPSVDTAIPTFRAGAEDYLIKPFDQKYLCSVVSRCVKKGASDLSPG
jgi:DNA-binding NtrC family response regulator